MFIFPFIRGWDRIILNKKYQNLQLTILMISQIFRFSLILHVWRFLFINIYTVILLTKEFSQGSIICQQMNLLNNVF